MATFFETLFGRVQSHFGASGLFEKVNLHEPKRAPGPGLTAALWVQSIAPVRSSGLTSTSGIITFMARIYQRADFEPQDAIDPKIADATSRMLSAFSGDFELGGNVRQIDLLGAYGPGLSAQAGYIEQDGKMQRVMDITIPIVVNDLWSQAP